MSLQIPFTHPWLTRFRTISGSATITPAPPATIPDAVVPTHISLRCQQESRLSSACSCLSLTPATVTSTALAPAETTTIANVNNLAAAAFSSPVCEELESPYTVNNKQYDIHCGTVFQGSFMNSDGAGLGSMEECMLACSMIDDCIAVDWAEEELQCGLLSALQADLVEGFNSAVLVVES
jgi:hypothetical protein